MPLAPRVTLRVVPNRGQRLLELVDLTFRGKVVHAYHLELMQLPADTEGNEDRLALLVDLGDGVLLFAETTLPLLRAAVEELSPHGPH